MPTATSGPTYRQLCFQSNSSDQIREISWHALGSTARSPEHTLLIHRTLHCPVLLVSAELSFTVPEIQLSWQRGQDFLGSTCCAQSYPTVPQLITEFGRIARELLRTVPMHEPTSTRQGPGATEADCYVGAWASSAGLIPGPLLGPSSPF